MSYCIIIPNYNHTVVIDTVIDQLLQFKLPLILVDDGSDDAAKKVFKALEQKHASLTLVTHEVNQGKGGAVKTGLLKADELGFSHAIQVDADGQHTLTDIATMLSLSQQRPDTLFSGQPVYDDSVPTHRLWSRYITHFWVWVETLSFAIKDSMCGFRVYPVKACTELISQVNLGNRMDFDTEILVRLYWNNMAIEFVPTKVIYPENGISHFRPFKDNVGISWLHTRLFFGMLIRAPKLISQNIKSRS